MRLQLERFGRSAENVSTARAVMVVLTIGRLKVRLGVAQLDNDCAGAVLIAQAFRC
jgi:hypothetical protein